MKILCFINHYYGKNSDFKGKSTESVAEERLKTINTCINQLKKIESIDIKICGISGFSLLPIDIDFQNIKSKPTYLVYESLNYMKTFINQYDYFINVEDDIFVPEETIQNVIEFDKTAFLNEVLHPNRLETDGFNEKYCTDIYALRTWTYQQKEYLGKTIRTALNPHSAILIMSRDKLAYAFKHIKPDFREIIIGKEMASAYTYFHQAFVLYRSYSDINFHYVEHMDTWSYIPELNKETKINFPDGIRVPRKEKKWKILLKKIIPKFLISFIRK